MARKDKDIRLIVQMEVDRAIRDAKRMDNSIDDMGKSAKTAMPSMKGLAGVTSGFIGALAVKELALAVVELGKLGAQARNVEKAFRQLDNSDELLESMRKNIRGSVSDLELMRQAITALDLGATNEQMEIFTKFARFEAVRKGGDELQLLQNILGGVLRGSTELLDNFGLSLTQVQREEENLAKAMGRRLTKMSAAERRTLRVQAATNLMAQRLEVAGDAALESADHSTNAAAAWENLQVQIGKMIDQPVDDFFSVAADAMNFATEALKSLEKQFISFQLSVLNKIDPSFQKLLRGLDEHSKKIINNDQQVQQFMDIWVMANTQLAKAKENLQLINNVYGDQSQQAKDATSKVEENARIAHESYLLLQQRVVELRKELGKPLDLGGGEAGEVVDPKALDKAKAAAKRLAEEYDGAMQLIRESGEKTSKQIIADAQAIIDKYQELKRRNVELDREQIEMAKEISETSLAEAIAVADYLLEHWEFTEEERKKMLDMRKEWIKEASEFELEQARKTARELAGIFDRPMQTMLEAFILGTRSAQEIWQNFIDFLLAELARFLTSKIVNAFMSFLVDAFTSGAGGNIWSMLSAPFSGSSSSPAATATSVSPATATAPSPVNLPSTAPPPQTSFLQPGSISNVTTDNSRTVDSGSWQLIINGNVYGDDQKLLDGVKQLQQEHLHRISRSINDSIL